MQLQITIMYLRLKMGWEVEDRRHSISPQSHSLACSDRIKYNWITSQTKVETVMSSSAAITFYSLLKTVKTLKRIEINRRNYIKTTWKHLPVKTLGSKVQGADSGEFCWRPCLTVRLYTSHVHCPSHAQLRPGQRKAMESHALHTFSLSISAAAVDGRAPYHCYEPRRTFPYCQTVRRYVAVYYSVYSAGTSSRARGQYGALAATAACSGPIHI
jgi:hypothetical protein